MSSRMQQIGSSVVAMFVLFLFTSLVSGALPAAAQDSGQNSGMPGPVGVILVVDEWDGEVMTGGSTALPGEGAGEGEGDGGDAAVDEWDGEVMTGGARLVGEPGIVLLVVARSGQGALRQASGTGTGDEGDAAVDEWDGEVMTGGARAGSQGGHCRLRVAGAERSYRVLRVMGLGGIKTLLELPQPVRRAASRQ